MTNIAMVEGGEGERRLRDRRRGFWKMVGIGMLIAVLLGGVLGFVAGFTKGWQDAGGQWIGWVVWPLLAATLMFFWRFSADYFRRVDELDLLDNLWSSLIGLYAVVAAFPGWALLHEVGQLPPPSAQGLWWIAMGATLVAYGARKLRQRF